MVGELKKYVFYNKSTHFITMDVFIENFNFDLHSLELRRRPVRKQKRDKTAIVSGKGV